MWFTNARTVHTDLLNLNLTEHNYYIDDGETVLAVSLFNVINYKITV